MSKTFNICRFGIILGKIGIVCAIQMDQRTDRLYSSTPLENENIDIEQRLEVKVQ